MADLKLAIILVLVNQIRQRGHFEKERVEAM